MRRRILGLTLLVAPALSLAQTDGQLVSATVDHAFINAAECTSTATDFDVFWDIRFETGFNAIPAGGSYRVFASTEAPAVANATGGGTLAYCDESSTADPVAGPVSDLVTVSTTDSGTRTMTPFGLSGNRIATTTKFACDDPASDGKTIYVCVHAYDGSDRQIGVASGRFQLSLRAPGAPAIVGGATPGNESLRVSWTAPSGSPAATEYEIEAKAVDPTKDASTHLGDRTTSLDGTVRGLVNEVEYSVRVRAYSDAGNPGPFSGEVLGTPVFVDGFWDVYDGPEQGGCASGPAGALALVGVAAIVALRRRRS